MAIERRFGREELIKAIESLTVEELRLVVLVGYEQLTTTDHRLGEDITRILVAETLYSLSPKQTEDYGNICDKLKDVMIAAAQSINRN